MSYAEQPTETAFVVVVAWIVYFDFIDVLYNTLSTCLISQVIYYKMWPANNHQNILRPYINSWNNANSYQVSQYSSH